ncbi:MAG: 30S ribosomal protein S19 [Candidatus Thermoplasmatota archaeon]|nr:30S ribosomal protein S19 [Candidatus Thermoplasmatota archaeon]MBS3789871.1 30S ribosomal protein S19 [Candidatus Thermoplasmatota archaeon]
MADDRVSRDKREFTYRGYTLDELKNMSLDELKKVLPARARRTLKRGLNIEEKRLLERIEQKDKDVYRTHRREMIILPEFVGKRIAIHDGEKFKTVKIEPEMIGHYLGEFVLTRKQVEHSGPGIGATRSSKYIPLK